MLQENGGAQVSGTASVKIGNQKDVVAVYPNPFTDKLYVTTTLQQKDNVGIEIYDHTGKCVHRQTETADEGRQTIYADQLEALPPGMYEVIVEANGSRHSLRAVK